MDERIFRDRKDAGRELAEMLRGYRGKDVIILGIPRGGVVVANEIANELNAPLSIIVPKKFPLPGIRSLLSVPLQRMALWFWMKK